MKSKTKQASRSIHVGMKVEVCNLSVATPISYETNPNGTRCVSGEIVEVLNNGGFAVKFHGYPHAWDYSRFDKRCFRQYFK